MKLKYIFLTFIFALTISNHVKAQCATGETEALLNIIPDNYGSETTWEFSGPGGSPVYASGGPYTDDNTTPINVSVCLDTNAVVMFTIFDSYGDGICCGEGNGSYTVTIDGISVASGAEYTTSESTLVLGNPLDFDCMIQLISSPSLQVSSNETATISGTLMNTGAITVTDLSLSYQIGTEAVVTESFSPSSLAFLDQYEFSFSTLWSPASTGEETIVIWVKTINNVSDMNPSNDNVSTNVNVYEATVIPNILGDYLEGTPTYTTIATASDQLDKPTDLDFHPFRNQELWVINEENVSGGGTTLTISNASEPTQSIEFKEDGNNWHFMSLPTAMAFGTNGNWASSPGVFDANHNGTEFTGPTLWSSDMSIYAENAGPGTNGSHLDMLHESPHSMGIAHHSGNAYWVFDGHNTDIVFYDFKQDHGPGQSYHDDAVIHRYEDVNVARDGSDPTIPSHLILNKDNGWLYIVDIGNDRVIRMNTATGSFSSNLTGYESVAEYAAYMGVEQETVVDTGLEQPCGIDIIEDRMIVSDYANGDIRFYDISETPASYLGKIETGVTGITGVKIGPEGNIWYANRLTNEVLKIEPENTLGIIENSFGEGLLVFPNPTGGNFSIDLGNNYKTVTISMTDLNGKLIQLKTYNDNQVLNLKIDQPIGVYLLIIESGDKKAVIKLIKE
tara:strand:- start:703 stop:2727 length:2025 start_codon:yes stop_codon:yes gene_type:complete